MILSSLNLIPSTITVVNEEPHTIVKAEVSAYTSSVGETDDTPYTTASGSEVRAGIVACPARYNFGTIIEIEGKRYTCEDRMNQRYRQEEVYDIWMPSKELAYEWGRKQVNVKIYGN